jgi:hypothetical protein
LQNRLPDLASRFHHPAVIKASHNTLLAHESIVLQSCPLSAAIFFQMALEDGAHESKARPGFHILRTIDEAARALPTLQGV